MSGLKYKILIPVMAEVEEFKRCVNKCPDKSKLIIINNWDNEEIANYCSMLEEQGAELHKHPENLGCGPSWNIGIRKLQQTLDYIIILSPAALFTYSVEDFADIVEKMEAEAPGYFYHSIGTYKTDTHAFAITRRCYQEVGLFDENFYPIYFEDTDYQYRMKLIGKEKTPVHPPRICQGLSMGVGKDKRIFDLYWKNIDHIHDYYIRKWGGDHNQEKFKTPFNDPNLSIKHWSLEEDKIIRS